MEGAYLDDEDEDGVLGVVSGWVGSLEDASLIGCPDGHGDKRIGYRIMSVEQEQSQGVPEVEGGSCYRG